MRMHRPSAEFFVCRALETGDEKLQRAAEQNETEQNRTGKVLSSAPLEESILMKHDKG